MRKFIRRHPASTALGLVSAVAALAVVGFVVGQIYNARLATTNANLVETSGRLEDALQVAKTEKARAPCSMAGERFWNGHRSNIGVEKLS